MNTIINQPIAYDYHGDIPLEVPFNQIPNNEIHVYLDIDTFIGKNTCGQNCQHCWFVNYQKVFQKSFGIDEGLAITTDLKKSGFKVFARYVDSFAHNGKFMKLYGPAHNREFRQDEAHLPTKTMEKGDAWTSGRPLLSTNYLELLKTAVENGYGTISITFHGLFLDSQTLLDHSHYPIKGVFSGKDCVEVISRIKAFNKMQLQMGQAEQTLRINIGVTVGKHNHTPKHILNLLKFFEQQGVDTVRFNNFTDHGRNNPTLPLSDEEVSIFYKNIKEIHKNYSFKLQIALSEDFGTPGIEIMEFPKHVGWCRAGKQLFTVIPSEKSVVYQSDLKVIEKMGDIVGCVNIFEPHFGQLLKITKKNSSQIEYQLLFNAEAIDDFAAKRTNGEFKNGCFAKEWIANNPPQLIRPKRKEHNLNLDKSEVL